MNQFFQAHQILINNIALGLFVLSLVFLALLIIRFRKVKLAESGECLNCRYPLRGLDTQTEACPECGKKLTPADWSPTVRWRRPGVYGLFMHPYAIWACFAFCFVGSVFLGVKVIPSTTSNLHYAVVPMSNLVNTAALNNHPQEAHISAVSDFHSQTISFGSLPILQRRELIPGGDKWIVFLPRKHGGNMVYVHVEPQTMHFGFKDLPSTFKDAPGLIESQTLPHPASNQLQRRGYSHAVPVNLESIERMTDQWILDGSLNARPTQAELDQIFQELQKASGWLKSSKQPDIEWHWLYLNTNNSHSTHTTNWTWLSSRALPTLIAIFIVGFLLIGVRHKKRKLEGLVWSPLPFGEG